MGATMLIGPTAAPVQRSGPIAKEPGERAVKMPGVRRANAADGDDERDAGEPRGLGDDEHRDDRKAPGPMAGEEVAEAPAQARGQREQGPRLYVKAAPALEGRRCSGELVARGSAPREPGNRRRRRRAATRPASRPVR
jgi:hypothetical protein